MNPNDNLNSEKETLSPCSDEKNENARIYHNEWKSPSVPDVSYEGVLRPGLFSAVADADQKRKEFDIKNQCILVHRKKVDFVFIGDSLTDFWELSVYFNRPDQYIVNRGIGGDIIANLTRRFEADCVQLKPDYVVLQIGINNANAMEPNIWKAIPGRPLDEVTEKAIRDYTLLLELAEKHKLKLIVGSLLPTNMTFSPVNRERQQYVLRLNAFLQDYCRQHGHIYCDYFSELAASDGVSIIDNITQEGLHPLVHGYDIMASTLRNTLKEHDILI